MSDRTIHTSISSTDRCPQVTCQEEGEESRWLPRQLKETRQPASEAGTRGSPTITTTWKNSSPQPSPPKAGATEKPTRWSLGFPRWREPSTIPGTLQPLPSAQGPQLHLTWLTPNSPQGKAYTQSENWLCPAPTGGQTAGRG